MTRDELRGQKEQLRAQNDTISRQRFENTFFQLLGLHNDMVSTMDIRTGQPPNQIVKGRDCFAHIYRELASQFDPSWKPGPSQSYSDQINRVYGSVYGKYEADLSHYFRNLYNIVKFIHLSNMDDKKFYTNLLRAQLSTHELLLLFYNCLSDKGAEKFKPLVEAYHLLKTMPTDRSHVAIPDHLDLYSRTAFNASQLGTKAK